MANMGETYLVHYGVEGMKWGVRRYQNADGTLTAEGRARYGNRYGDMTTLVRDTKRAHRENSSLYKSSKYSLKNEYRSGNISRNDYKYKLANLKNERDRVTNEITKTHQMAVAQTSKMPSRIAKVLGGIGGITLSNVAAKQLADLGQPALSLIVQYAGTLTSAAILGEGIGEGIATKLGLDELERRKDYK